MIKLPGIELYVGTKEEIDKAVEEDMQILCAVNVCGDHLSYRTVAGATKKGHPDYLYKYLGRDLYLNLVDGDDPRYIPDKMIDVALRFIADALKAERKVFIYCSKGESRSPSIALMYLLSAGKIKPQNAFQTFKQMYPSYNPTKGIKQYIINRFKVK